MGVGIWMFGIAILGAAAVFVTAVRRPALSSGKRMAKVRVGRIFEASYEEVANT